MVNYLLIVFQFVLLSISPCNAGGIQSPHLKSDKKAVAVKAKILKAFGGEENLKSIEYITYTLSRKVYRQEDTISTRQLWYMHMQNPLVVKLEIAGTDTTVFYTNCDTEVSPAHKNQYNAMLRSRFFNFFYLLTTSEAAFQYVRKDIYKGSKVDIIRVTNKIDPKLSLDLFVNSKGQIVTTSTESAVSGQYERFGDEFNYAVLPGNVVFPLHYKVVEREAILVEGVFSDLQINRLSPIWKKQIKSITTDSVDAIKVAK